MLKRNPNHLKYLLSLLFIFMFLLNVNFSSNLVSPSLLREDIEKDDSMDLLDEVINEENIVSAENEDPEMVDSGYTTPFIEEFDVLQNATSSVTKRNHKVVSDNTFEIATPFNWTADNETLYLKAYERNQIIRDNDFNDVGSPWSRFQSVNGLGTISQGFEYGFLFPKNGFVNIQHDGTDNSFPGFMKNDFAIWQQTPNPLSGRELIKGKKYQEKNESQISFSDFASSTEFKQHVGEIGVAGTCPYGGIIADKDNVNLGVISGDLYVDIIPWQGVGHGNPSSCWWHYFNLPYEADYAEISITWKIDSVSDYQANNNYSVRARIDDQYINGDTMLVRKSDVIPLIGNDQELIRYNRSLFLEHGFITRTYNITQLLNGAIGRHKFDFGVFAKDPIGEGRFDRIKTVFDSIVLRYNTSDKYEVGTVEIEYSCDDPLYHESEVLNDPYKVVNKAILGMSITASGYDTIFLPILPFSELEYDGVRHYINYSVPSCYASLLESDTLDVKYGVRYVRNSFDATDMYLRYFETSLTLNYGYDDINTPGIEYSIDGSDWNSLNDEELTISGISSWKPGEDHEFSYRSAELDVFLNIKSVLKLVNHSTSPDAAYAKYVCETLNSEYGTWWITYNNTFEYLPLHRLNRTSHKKFNLSSYSISFLNLPAFDGGASNSNNWNLTNAYFGNQHGSLDYTSSMQRFNYTKHEYNQSVMIKNAYQQGNWTIKAIQPNYIVNRTFNSSIDTRLGDDIIIFYRGQILKYNYTLAEAVKGIFNLTLADEAGVPVSNFPKYLSNDDKDLYVNGTIDISLDYELGEYYIGIKWNDSSQVLGRIRRFGSDARQIRIHNATNAQFIRHNTSVEAGNIANMTIQYRTNYSNDPINTNNLWLQENSTGEWRLWGKAWSPDSMFNFTYKGGGIYEMDINSTGAPNGKYSLRVVIWKEFHQTWILNASLTVSSTEFLIVNISSGATWNEEYKEFIINSDNRPYVNDSINSIIQINVTKQSDRSNITDATVRGRIGLNGSYINAQHKVNGLYDLIIDTTGLNATYGNDNYTLYIFASKEGFGRGENNVTLKIDPIPSQLTLDSIDDAYQEDQISLSLEALTLVDSANPEFFNKGNLTYYLYNHTNYAGSEYRKTGILEFWKNGLYSKDIDLSGLAPDTYTLYVNTTQFNHAKNSSNQVTFEIIPRHSTQIKLDVPDTVRMLQEITIGAELSYKGNDTKISGKTITFNITSRREDGYEESLIVLKTTDSEGLCSIANYIISSEFEGGTLIITTNYSGDLMIAPSGNLTTRSIGGLIPIMLNITNYPNQARVGYSATYEAIIDIKDESESLDDRIILFSAYYENEITSPFVTQQLYTDADGKCSYTISQIADGKNNLTVYFEYLGSSTVAYNLTSRSDDISSKWTSNISLSELPSIIRFGQSVSFRLNFTCENVSISLESQSVSFTIEYGNTIETYTEYINAQQKIYFNYTIPDSFNSTDGIRLTVSYSGTEKITGDTLQRVLEISSKITVNINWVQSPQFITMNDEYYFSVKATDDDSNPIAGLPLVFEVLDSDNAVLLTVSSTTNAQGIASATLSFDEVGDQFSIRVRFAEYNIYASSLLSSVQNKKDVGISFRELPGPQYMTGDYDFFIIVEDEFNNTLSNFNLIFEVLNDAGVVVYQTNATSNEDGLVSAKLSLSAIGNTIKIRVRFEGKGVFKSSEFTSEAIRVVNSFIVFLDYLPYILIAAAIVAAVMFSINRFIILPRERRRLESLKQLYQKLSDVENVQYILVLTKDGGVPIFSKSLADVPIDESLVSGFLSAISTFGEEIGSKMKEKGESGGLEDLSYRQFKITLKEGQYARTALLLLKRASPILKTKLAEFNKLLEERFEDRIKKFSGEVLRDMEVTPIIEKVFQADLLYPHQLIERRANEYVKELPRKDLSKEIISTARSTEFESNFYVRDMINSLKTKGIEEIKSFESLEKLKSDKVIFALNPRTNYLITELQPIIKKLSDDDRNVLFAIFDGETDEIGIIKYLKKQGISKEVDINSSLNNLKELNIIEGDNALNNNGTAIATLLRLIPGL